MESLSIDVSDTWTATGSWVFSSLAIALKCQTAQIAPKAVKFAFRSSFTSQRCLCLSSQYKEREDEMSRCQHVTATRAIVHYYFPVFLFPYSVTFGESCPYKKKKKKKTTPTHTHKKTNKTKHFWRSLRSTIRTLSQAKSKLRAQKSIKTANRCNCRIRKSVKILLWIQNPGENTVRIRWSVSLFTPLTKCLIPFYLTAASGEITKTWTYYGFWSQLQYNKATLW